MTRVRLGELLLSRGACTREQLAAAWENKVLYGDRLGTNLLATGAVTEAVLAATLGAQHGVHGGHGDVLHIDPAAIALLPAAVALKRKVVPHHVADRVLYLLMSDPDNLRAIDDVRFATRLKVQPIVVCEARLWKLLAEHYGGQPSLRPNPLDQLRPTVGGASSSSSSASSKASGAREPVADLVSEEDFQLMYARLAATPLQVDSLGDPEDLEPEPAPVVVVVPPAQAVAQAVAQGRDSGGSVVGAPVAAAPVAEAPDWQGAPRLTRPSVLDMPSPLPLSATPSMPPSMPASTSADPLPSPAVLSAPAAGPEAAEQWQRSLEVTNPMRAKPRLLAGFPEIELVEVIDDDPETIPPDGPVPFALSRTNTSQVHAAVDLSPLSFADAVSWLGRVSDRDDIARVVLRAARSHFARAALLTVYPHAFVGWQGVGDGFEDIASVSIPRDAQSVFSLVADSRAHYLGPLQRFTAHGSWVKTTGKRIPRSLLVLPILVRGRTVSLLVVDNGHDQHVGSDVGELLILAQHIATSYETLIQRG